MRVKYVGPSDAVEVPAVGVVCRRGEAIEVPADLGRSLVEQACWTSAAAKKEDS